MSMQLVSEAICLWQAGLTVSSIAKELGRSKGEISGLIHRNRQYFLGRSSPIQQRNQAFIAEVRALWLSDKSAAEIGAIIGKSANGVRCMARRYDFGPKPISPELRSARSRAGALTRWGK
jgi:hypothetical protein